MAFYKQIKVSVEPTLAESFKTVCMNSGVSMATELSSFMAARSGVQAELTAKEAKQAKASPCYDTRPKRRQHIRLIIPQLEAIRDYESTYRENIPLNLQTSRAYEAAEHAVDTLEQAIDLLNDAY